jgi:pre-rRNA-processing protein TSR1
MAIEGTIHRAGALKQTNKSHKHGKHRSNRQIDTENKGKMRNLSTSSELHEFLLHRKSFGEGSDEKQQQDNAT